MEQEGGVTVGDEIALYGMVGDDYMGQGFTSKAVLQALAGKTGDVTVRLNSGGGIAWEGAAIHAILMGYKDKGKVTVRVEGIAASAASLIAMAGDRVEMATGALMMIHDPSALTFGTAADHKQSAEMLDKLAANYADVYAARAKMTPKKARELMLAETWMTADEAVKMGFADECYSAAPATAAAFDYTVFAKAPVELVAMAKYRGWVLARSGEQPQAAVVTARPVEMTTPVLQMEQTIMTDETTPAPVMVADTAKIEMAAEVAKAAAAERERVKMITAKCAKLGLPTEFADELIDGGVSLEAAAVRMIDKMAERSPQTMAIPASPTRVLVDERDTMRVGMQSAIAAQIMRKAPEAPQGAAFMGMTLVEMAAASTGHRGSLRTYGDKERVLMSAMHSTSDFPGLLENALNKTLQTRYAEQTPVYRNIARRMTFNDFRNHSILRTGDLPILQEISEGGEIRAGTFSESKETVVAKSYGIQLPISRQILINDDLSSIADLLSNQGAMIARFEDTTFFSLLLSASGAGPTLSTTGRAMFNTTDVSLAGTASTIDLSNMSIARAALRKRTGLDGALLDVSPRFLLVGPDRETVAQQILAPVTPQQASNVQVFSDGSLTLLVSSRITGNAWYLFADPALTPNFVYGYLAGYEQPRVRMDEPFGMQGVSYSFEHDFGVGAIDYRGAFRNAGA